MYTLWLRQYVLATQAGVELLSNVYVEWSKGVVQLAGIGLGLPVSDEHFDDDWLDTVLISEDPARIRPHTGNCAASVYSREGFSLARPAANAPSWIQCIHEA